MGNGGEGGIGNLLGRFVRELLLPSSGEGAGADNSVTHLPSKPDRLKEVNEYRKLRTEEERRAFVYARTQDNTTSERDVYQRRLEREAKQLQIYLDVNGYKDVIIDPNGDISYLLKPGMPEDREALEKRHVEEMLEIDRFRLMSPREQEAFLSRLQPALRQAYTLAAADLDKFLRQAGCERLSRGADGKLLMIKKEAKGSIDELTTCAPADATKKLVHLGLKLLLMVPDPDNKGKFIPKVFDPEDKNIPRGARRPTVDEINRLFGWVLPTDGEDSLKPYQSEFMRVGFTGACRSEKGPNEEEDVYLNRFIANVDTPLCNSFNALAVRMSQREVEALAGISDTQINASTICWQLDSDTGLASSAHVYFNGGWRFPKDADFVRNLINILRNKSINIPGMTLQRREELATELYSKFNTLLKQAETIDKQPETIDKQLWIALAGLGLTAVFIGVLIWQRFEQKRMMEGGRKLPPEEYLRKHTRNLTADAKTSNGGGYVDLQGVFKKLTVALAAGRSPVLLGEAGVGKTAAVEGYAAALASGVLSKGEINALKKSGINPQRVEILELLPLSLQGVEGGQYRTVVEQHFRKIIEAVEKINAGEKRQILLFVDEAQLLASIGKAEGAAGIMEYIKPMLARGGRIILASNNLGSLGADDAMMRRMEPITIYSPESAETLRILKRLDIPRMTDPIIKAVMENAPPTFTNDGRPICEPARSIAALKSFSALMEVDKPEDKLSVQDVESWAREKWGDVVRGLKDKYRAVKQERLFGAILRDLNTPQGRRRAEEIIRLLSDPRTAQAGFEKALEIYSGALAAQALEPLNDGEIAPETEAKATSFDRLALLRKAILPFIRESQQKPNIWQRLIAALQGDRGNGRELQLIADPYYKYAGQETLVLEAEQNGFDRRTEVFKLPRATTGVFNVNVHGFDGYIPQAPDYNVGQVDSRFYITIDPARYVERVGDVIRALERVMTTGHAKGLFFFKVYPKARFKEGGGGFVTRRDQIVIYFNSSNGEAVRSAVESAMDSVAGSDTQLFSEKGPYFTSKLRRGLFFGAEPVDSHESFGRLRAKAIKEARIEIEDIRSRGGIPTENEILEIVARAFERHGIDPENPAFNLSNKARRAEQFSFVEGKGGGKGGKGGPVLGIIANQSIFTPETFELPQTWAEVARDVMTVGRNTLAGGGIFLAGEYISEAIIAAARGDWSRLKGISAIHVLKDFGGLTVGHKAGVAMDKLLLNAFPSIAKVPGAQSFSSRFFPMFTAIMALHIVRGEEVTAGGTLLTMGNIATAQGITSGAWKLVDALRRVRAGVSAVGHASKPLRAHPLAMIATVSAEFLIIKLLGELESHAFNKMALNDAKKAASALIAKNNELIARMQRDPDSVDAAEFMQVQMALAHLQEQIAANSHAEARYGVADEIARLEREREELYSKYFNPAPYSYERCKKNMKHGYDAVLACEQRYHEQYKEHLAWLDKRIMHLRFMAEGKAAAAGGKFKELAVPVGGVVPYANIPEEKTYVIPAIPDRVVGGIYYDGVPSRTSKTNPRQVAINSDLADDTWTTLSNQINRYVASQNAQLIALAEQQASPSIASK